MAGPGNAGLGQGKACVAPACAGGRFQWFFLKGVVPGKAFGQTGGQTFGQTGATPSVVPPQM